MMCIITYIGAIVALIVVGILVVFFIAATADFILYNTSVTHKKRVGICDTIFGYGLVGVCGLVLLVPVFVPLC